MRALTLTQPWCGLVAAGLKPIENRPRAMGAQRMIGERIALHAGREVDRDAWRRIIEIAPELALDYPGPMAERARVHRLAAITSAVIAVATIDKVLDGGWTPGAIAEHGDALTYGDGRLIGRAGVRWFFGPVGIVLRDTIALPAPVSCKGMLGFWTLPPDVEAAVIAQVGHG